jgi:hypothetical protein
MTDATPTFGRPSVMWGHIPHPYPGESQGTASRKGYPAAPFLGARL